jgi:SNF2 family DNA or RNA helicase
VPGQRPRDHRPLEPWRDIHAAGAPCQRGHGLNLQHGGSLIVWFGLCWSLEYYQQFNARLHRQGQQCAVRILHLVADGCLDERVLQVLANKDATQQQLLLALKAK